MHSPDLLNRSFHLHGAQQHRKICENEYDWAVKLRKVGCVLRLYSLEVPFMKQKFGIKIESCQSKLAVMVASRNFGVFNVLKSR